MMMMIMMMMMVMMMMVRRWQNDMRMMGDRIMMAK